VPAPSAAATRARGNVEFANEFANLDPKFWHAQGHYKRTRITPPVKFLEGLRPRKWPIGQSA